MTLLVVFTFFGLLVSGRILYQINYGSDDQRDVFDWEKSYPYTKKIEEIRTDIGSDTDESSSFIVRILNTFNGLGDEFVSLMPGQDEISRIGFVINSFLSDPSYSSNYIRLNNGHWTKKEYPADKAQLNNVADKYLSLQNYLYQNDIGFLYVQTPVKECRYDDELPYGIKSYANRNIDLFIELLKEKDISHLDLRDTLHEEGLDHYSMFYMSDHHWNVGASFWASEKIKEELSLNNSDTTFKTKEYPGAMFGSYGRAVTHVIADAEDFSVLVPESDTQFEIRVIEKRIDETGSFEEVFIDEDGLIEMMNNGGDFAYEMIAYGNKALIEISNLKNTDEPKILMIRDSFSIGVAPYLALSCSNLALIDTRADQGNFTGSIINYIDNYEPDIVIVLQSIPQDLKLNK